MKEVVHKVLWSSGDPNFVRRQILEEAKRVSLLGGHYQIEQFYSSDWYEQVTIWYPEKINPASNLQNSGS